MQTPSWTFMALAFTLLWVSMAQAAPRGHYTPDKLQAMQDNVAQHDWAKAQRDAILKRADRWLKYDAAHLRRLVPPAEIPRAITAHDDGAPVDGDALHKVGRYSWVISFDRPWKVKHPTTGAEYPSNDFEAFYQSGLDERGRFDRARADRSLLTGPYADDGHGAPVQGKAHPFWFVAYYNHWIVRQELLPALEDLSRAYLLTQDPRYATACGLLLWQLAEYYPDYFYEKQSRYALEVKSDYVGRLLYHTWEALFTCHVVPLAYDAIRPAIDADTALQAHLGHDGQAIRQHIEERLLRTMAKDIMDNSGRIQGNYGMHQVALLRVAAALRHAQGQPASEQMVRWVIHNPEAKLYVSIGLQEAIDNLIHSDGFPFESPAYSFHWVTAIHDIVTNLGPAAQSIVGQERYRRLFTWPFRMTVGGTMVPSYGDSETIFHRPVGWDSRLLLPAWKQWRDPYFARAIVQGGVKLRQDLFEPAVMMQDIQAAADKHPQPVGVTSELLSGVGIATLQANDGDPPTAMALFYGRFDGHAHSDGLQLDLYAHGHALTPDLGYPETANQVDPRRISFFSNTLTHNTVVVDGRRQARTRGQLHVYDPGPFVQLVEASDDNAYAGRTSLYRRTVMMVDASPGQSYIVDIFRVRGGGRHDWFVHGGQAEFVSDLPLTPPRQGTLAGPDVPYGHFYDDARFVDPNQRSTPNHLYWGSGFQWLFNVQQATLQGTGRVSWHLNRPATLYPHIPTQGVVLRAHLVGRDQQVNVADGKPQQRVNWPQTLKFVNRHRSGKDLESVFVTVYEPYRDQPFVRSVEGIDMPAGPDLPVALTVTLTDGRRHVVWSRLPSTGDASPTAWPAGLPAQVAADTQAGVVEFNAAQQPARQYALRLPGRATTAAVRRVDYEQGRIELAHAIDPPAGQAIAGDLAMVSAPSFGSVLRVTGLDGRQLAVDTQDLFIGRVDAQSVRAKGGGFTLTFTPRFQNVMTAGATLVNERGQAVARLVDIGMGQATIAPLGARRTLTLADFPDHDGDDRRSLRAAIVGPQDHVTLYTSSRDGVTDGLAR